MSVPSDSKTMLAHPQPFESDKSDQPHQVIWENFVGYAVLADCQKLRAIENLYGLPRLPIFTDHSVDFDQLRRDPLPPPANRSGAFELRLQAADFRKHRDEACRIIRELLMDNPHSTLRIVLEPMSDPASLTMSFLQAIRTPAVWRGFPGSASGQNGWLRNTILLVETKEAGIHYFEPRDLSLDQMPLTVNSSVGQGISSDHRRKS